MDVLVMFVRGWMLIGHGTKNLTRLPTNNHDTLMRKSALLHT